MSLRGLLQFASVARAQSELRTPRRPDQASCDSCDASESTSGSRSCASQYLDAASVIPTMEWASIRRWAIDADKNGQLSRAEFDRMGEACGPMRDGIGKRQPRNNPNPGPFPPRQ